MVDYNPKDWFSFIFRFHTADTFRTLSPMMCALGVYCGVVAFVEFEFLHITKDSRLANVSVMHSMLGFVISLLLVFRTNTAYERWWEGRKLWGALVNSSRNLAIKLSAMLPRSEHAAERHFFMHLIPNYAFALKNHLRRTKRLEEFTEPELLGHDDHIKVKHTPNRIARLLFEKVNELNKRGIITNEQFLTLSAEVQQFTDICGGCERIKNTPIPFSYSGFIKKFIFFYIMTLPLGYVFTVGYLIIPIVVFIFYVLASLELIAEEIEDPFGSDANDLPTDTIAGGIRESVFEILE
jgi:putative membrane protein